jgi:methionyl-tRNA formyltransferase
VRRTVFLLERDGAVIELALDVGTIDTGAASMRLCEIELELQGGDKEHLFDVARLLARALPRLIAGTAAAQPLDLARGSYFGRRTPEDGRIDWHCGAREVHDLVRAVAPPFPGAFTEVNGCRLSLWETRVDAAPATHPALAPCLYAADGHWYADCRDGRRIKILQLAIDGRLVRPNLPPPALSKLPLRLS